MKLYFNGYDNETLEKAESLLFNGNGFLGVRGCLEEAYYNHFATNRETYINGFYERKKLDYPEVMFGFPEYGESMISVVDGQTTLISVGEEALRIDSGMITESSRWVDLKKGVTVREFLWTSPQKRTTRFRFTRIASFVHENLFTLTIDIEKIDHDEPVYLTTHLNYQPVRTIDTKDPRINQDIQYVKVTEVDEANCQCHFETTNSKMKAALHWQIEGGTTTTELTDKRIILRTTLSGNTYVKKLSYAYHGHAHTGIELPFEKLLTLQEHFLTRFWDTAEVKIKSKEKLEESVNYSIYALLQSLGKDGKTSIAAKGLSGSGYEGHYFWDTEMYIFPLFLHVHPELAKKILLFRLNTLDKARENREMIGYRTGALYPWRTISGPESSPYFEAGSAQHHINADIAYAFISYFQHTDDLDFMIDGGFEVLLETGRVFTEIGDFHDGEFHIDKITGPDEYSALVNDNYYTNRMVKHQFEWINRLAKRVREEEPQRWSRLSQRLNLTEEELQQIAYYAEHMALPVEEERDILAQDRDYLNKALWPYTKAETKHPLLLFYHPLTIYRYQVSKQADAVLALMLFQDDFHHERIKNTVTYYDSVTTHDSSLSYSAFSIVYSRIGESEKGYRYFLENARVDLDNLHHNTKDGIHTASMAGTYLTIIYGFCNLRVNDEGITLQPHLPKEIEEIQFSILYRGAKYRIIVEQNRYEIVKEK